MAPVRDVMALLRLTAYETVPLPLPVGDDVTSSQSALLAAVHGVGVLGEQLGDVAAVRDEIRAGDEETRRQMRVLHEEVISRIALLDEGRKMRRRGKR